MVMLLLPGLAPSPPAVAHRYEPASLRPPTTSRAQLPGGADGLGQLVQEGPEHLHLVVVRAAEDLHHPAVELQDQGAKDQLGHLLYPAAGYFRSREPRAAAASRGRGTGTTQLAASTWRRATASRQRACSAKPRSIDSMELPSGRGPARLNMCPRASTWIRLPSVSSSVSR